MSKRYRIAIAVLVFPLLVLLLVLNGRLLLAQAYKEYAFERVNRNILGPDVFTATQLALRLSYDSPRAHALLGMLTARQDDPNVELNVYRRALMMSPADPALWQQLVIAKLAYYQFDDELEHAMLQVRRLAPRVLSIHVVNARLALEYWYWSDPSVKDLWYESLKFTLTHGKNDFLRELRNSPRTDVLCNEPRLKSLPPEDWCSTILRERELCFGVYSRHSADWCLKRGYRLDTFR